MRWITIAPLVAAARSRPGLSQPIAAIAPGMRRRSGAPARPRASTATAACPRRSRAACRRATRRGARSRPSPDAGGAARRRWRHPRARSRCPGRCWRRSRRCGCQATASAPMPCSPSWRTSSDLEPPRAWRGTPDPRRRRSPAACRRATRRGRRRSRRASRCARGSSSAGVFTGVGSDAGFEAGLELLPIEVAADEHQRVAARAHRPRAARGARRTSCARRGTRSAASSPRRLITPFMRKMSAPRLCSR